MNPVLKKILESGHVERPDGSLVNLESNISSEDGQSIQKILYELNPMRTLEVGMAYGVSTLFICEALTAVAGARHIVIDPYQNHIPNAEIGPESQPADPGWEGLGLNNVERAGYLNMVDFFEEPSYLALPQLVSEGIKIEFAFIDGMHTFDYALLDFFYVDLLLNVGGIVVIDDVNYPSISKVCRYVLQNRAYEVVGNSPQLRHAEPSHRKFLHRFRSFKEAVKPEILVPNHELGMLGNRQLCLRKIRDDVIMFKESDEYRNWATHREF